jgi:uncharacterized SAM-binding protein YcdF (DUF218 family)
VNARGRDTAARPGSEARPRRRRYALLFGALVLAVAIAAVGVRVVPVGAWLIETLETRFPPAPLPERVDGVIAISGEWFGERTRALVMLSKKYPGATVLYSGAATYQDPVRRFAHFGGDASRLLVEGQSEDTYQNAQFSAALVKPRPGQTWVLITSAYHMPRAVGSFRRAGFHVLPYPVDYQRTVRHFGIADAGRNWSQLEFALREWGALAIYRILGRTDALFPGPQ